MTNEELNTALYKKVFAEQEKYREWLLSQPPDEILNHCYEYTVREDIVLALEEYDLSDKQCKALLKSPSPLADDAAGGNGGTAAKGQELDINDHVVLDLQVHAHDIAALGVADLTHAVCIGDLADIVRVCEMLHDLCAIHTCHLSFLPSG